jgi:hypothetical protein
MNTMTEPFSAHRENSRLRRREASPQRATRFETATASPCRGPVPAVSPGAVALHTSAAAPEAPGHTRNLGQQGTMAVAVLPSA